MTLVENNTLPWWRRFRRRLYYGLLVFVLWVASRLSFSTGQWLGRSMARLASALRPAERQRALSNLALAFPEMDNLSRQKIFQDSVDALGENFYDTLAVPRLVRRKDVVRENLAQGERGLVDELKQLSRRGHGVLVLTGHLGCWELLGAWVAREMAQAGLGPLAVVTGSVHNPPVDRLIQHRRQKLGMKILPRHEGAAPLLRHLRGGGVVAVLLDQNTRVENLPIPFFGQNAPTPVGFARIALRYGIPVLPVALAKSGNGHLVQRAEAWKPSGNQQDTDKAVRELLLWCNQNLENLIRRNPAQWVWFHKRWASAKEPSTS